MGNQIKSDIQQHPLDHLLDDKHPLWRKLENEAGGTAAHSKAVADLCGKIASEIEIDEKVMRVASRFHDIGKAEQPMFFTENQRDENIHDLINNTLCSSQLISRHVGDSLIILVNDNSIPNEYLITILRIIAQHHGGGTTEYFLNKFKTENKEQEEIDVKPYIYIGLPPQTREAALLTIVDILEATIKSVFSSSKSPTMSIKEVIDSTMEKLLDEDRIGVLTLNDAKIIKEIANKEFTSLYHSRIQYNTEEKSKNENP